jgi:DNA-binding NarL/FixJ family response regulator
MNARVLLVDDHPLLRNGLRLLLDAQPDIKVVGEASDGDGAIAAAVQLTPDVIVMDIEMPGANGIDVTKQVLAVSPASRVIILSAFPDAHYVKAAVQAGARGYLLKGNAPAEVLSAVRAVVAGHTFMCPEATSALVETLKDALATGPAQAAPPLSPREREVMMLVVEGCRTKEIAARLGIGTKTVDTHRARLMKKLGCGSTAELVRYAIREGLAK